MQLLAFPVESLDVALAESEPAVVAATLMQSRQTILPRHLVAPDPGQLLPWRFVTTLSATDESANYSYSL